MQEFNRWKGNKSAAGRREGGETGPRLRGGDDKGGGGDDLGRGSDEKGVGRRLDPRAPLL